MKRILFTGGGGAGNEALWRLLGQRYTVYFGDADLAAINPSIPVNRRYQLPWSSDPNFVRKMADLCRYLNIDLLIPGVDEELLLLARSSDMLAPTSLMLPSAAYVETMLDKLQMAEALKAKEIPVPATHSLATGFGEIEFPCIVKPRTGRGSRGVRVVSAGEAQDVFNALGDAVGNYVVQNKVEGTEFTVQMIADRHRTLVSIVPVRVDVKRGITIKAEVVAEPRVIDACLAIHEVFPAAGCYNIQLMLSFDGQALPFEINPRISTTFCLAVAADVDPIAEFLGGNRSNGLLPITTGVQLQRHWVNYFSNKSA